MICGCLWEAFQRRQSTTRKDLNSIKRWEVSNTEQKDHSFPLLWRVSLPGQTLQWFPITPRIKAKILPVKAQTNSLVPGSPTTSSHTMITAPQITPATSPQGSFTCCSLHLRNVLSKVIFFLKVSDQTLPLQSPSLMTLLKTHPPFPYYIIISLWSLCPVKK